MSRILSILAVIGCGLALDPTPAAAQVRFSPERIFDYYDQDRDGELDDDEIERVRGPLRERLEGRDDVSRDEFIRLAEEQQRDGDGGRDRDRDVNRNSRQSGPKPRERVTLELPSRYTEGDSDKDGQLGLYEWIQWKSRVSIPEFLALDRNRDGFLTPYELTIAEKSNGSGEGGNGSGGNPGTSGTRPGSAPSGGPRPRLDEATVQVAREAFRNLAGEDGKISEEEWQNSRATRSRFQDAGVELKLPADLDTFLSLYPAEQSSAPAAGSDATGSDGQSRERDGGGDSEGRFRGRGFSRGGR